MFRHGSIRSTALTGKLSRHAFAWILAGTFTGAACSDGDGNRSPVAPQGPPIAVDVESTDISPEGTGVVYEVEITATVRDQEGSVIDNAIVSWQLNLDGVGDGTAEIASLRPNGPRTARVLFFLKESGTVTVTASRGNRSAKTSIHVSAKSRTPTNQPLSGAAQPGEMIIWQPGGGVERIPPPSPASETFPEAINDRGEVVGSVTFKRGGRRSPFFWSPETGYVLIPISATNGDVVAADVNEAGTVVGTIWLPGGKSRAFMWSQAAGVQTLPDDAGTQTIGMSINRAGHVAGVRNHRPFIWKADEGFGAIAREETAPASYEPESEWAVALTDADELLNSWNGKYQEGVDYNFAPDGYPSVWSRGVRTSLSCRTCLVSGMNERREVVGATWPALKAFRWTESRGIEMLATPGGFHSEAVSINNAGMIAGSLSWWDAATLRKAVAWDGQAVFQLDLEGVRISASRDVNNKGQVLVFVR